MTSTSLLLNDVSKNYGDFSPLKLIEDINNSVSNYNQSSYHFKTIVACNVSAFIGFKLLTIPYSTITAVALTALSLLITILRYRQRKMIAETFELLTTNLRKNLQDSNEFIIEELEQYCDDFTEDEIMLAKPYLFKNDINYLNFIRSDFYTITEFPQIQLFKATPLQYKLTKNYKLIETQALLEPWRNLFKKALALKNERSGAISDLCLEILGRLASPKRDEKSAVIKIQQRLEIYFIRHNNYLNEPSERFLEIIKFTDMIYISTVDQFKDYFKLPAF